MTKNLEHLKEFLESIRFDDDMMKAFVDEWDGMIDEFGYVSIYDAKDLIWDTVKHIPQIELVYPERPYVLCPVVHDNERGWSCHIDDFVSRKDDGFYAIENLPFGD